MSRTVSTASGSTSSSAGRSLILRSPTVCRSRPVTRTPMSRTVVACRAVPPLHPRAPLGQLLRSPLHVRATAPADGDVPDVTELGCVVAVLGAILRLWDELRGLQAHGLDVTVEHRGIAQRTTRKKKSTTERGYGWTHQKQRDRLLYHHRDGTPCWWCGLPMYRGKTKNWGGKLLAADHDERDVAKRGTAATRWLHGDCNDQTQGHEKRSSATRLHRTSSTCSASHSRPAGILVHLLAL